MFLGWRGGRKGVLLDELEDTASCRTATVVVHLPVASDQQKAYLAVRDAVMVEHGGVVTTDVTDLDAALEGLRDGLHDQGRLGVGVAEPEDLGDALLIVERLAILLRDAHDVPIMQHRERELGDEGSLDLALIVGEGLACKRSDLAALRLLFALY